MPFQRSLIRLTSSNGPITLAYKDQVKAGLYNLDSSQLHLSATLDSLYSSLSAPSSHRFIIPDEQLDHAAAYYAGSSSLSIQNFTGIAWAKARFVVNPPPKGVYIHGSVGVCNGNLYLAFVSNFASRNARIFSEIQV